MLSIRNLRAAAVTADRLDLARGDCVVLTGPSGGGKSRLLRAIVDLDPSTAEVTLDGTRREAIPAPVWRRRVALVPAESGWWADRVSDHLPGGDPRPLIEALGLPAEAAGWDVGRLSSGERHRLAIVRALMGAPEYLLLDEPSAALDADATRRLEALLAERRAGGLGLVVVTHDAEQAERLGGTRRTVEGGRLAPADAPRSGATA